MGAAAFYGTNLDVSEIEAAYELLSPTLGVGIASTLFAVALLASGQNSTITGTMSGQIVMEGFIRLRISPWLRRLITRLLAVIPAFIVTWIAGSKGTGELLLWSQVVLSLALPFAVIPLVLFTSDKKKNGRICQYTTRENISVGMYRFNRDFEYILNRLYYYNRARFRIIALSNQSN